MKIIKNFLTSGLEFISSNASGTEFRVCVLCCSIKLSVCFYNKTEKKNGRKIFIENNSIKLKNGTVVQGNVSNDYFITHIDGIEFRLKVVDNKVNFELERLKHSCLPEDINTIRKNKSYSKQCELFNKKDLVAFIDYYKQRSIEYFQSYSFVFKESSEYSDFGEFTPHIYILQREGKDLVVKYIGAIDDNSEMASAVTKKYAETALDELLKGEAVKTPFTKAIGCGVKWKK